MSKPKILVFVLVLLVSVWSIVFLRGSTTATKGSENEQKINIESQEPSESKDPLTIEPSNRQEDSKTEEQLDASNLQITYSYEKVKYWENIIAQDKQTVKDWENEGPRGSKEKLAKLINTLEQRVEIANRIWDAYTNSSVTNGEMLRLEASYQNKKTESEQILVELKDEFYSWCLGYWEEEAEKGHISDPDAFEPSCKEVYKLSV